MLCKWPFQYLVGLRDEVVLDDLIVDVLHAGQVRGREERQERRPGDQPDAAILNEGIERFPIVLR